MEYKIKKSLTKTEITKPSIVHKVLKSVFDTFDDIDKNKEHFFVLMVDSRHKFKALDLVSIGTINSTLVHPREVYIRAIRNGASNIIIAHNHPSGDVTPSTDDRNITERLVKAGYMLGIPILDSVIFSDKEIYSMKISGDI